MPEPVEFTAETVGKSIDSVKIKGQGNDLVLDTSSFYMPTEAGAYPIVLPPTKSSARSTPDADVAKAVKAFLTSAIGDGQKGLEDNGYIPVPDSFKSKLTEAISAIS